ncbi:MAG: HD domain-containing protein [Nanoarchaeota archaeon]
MLALKRGLDMEVASIAAAFHDIAVVVTKKKKNHAEKSEKIIKDFIYEYNQSARKNLPKITEEETDIIIKAARLHSRKEDKSDNPMVELIKDVDSFDRYLHGIKSEGAYLERCIKVIEELDL